jgi:hypothetical protein
VGRVNRLTDRRVLRRAAQQALTLPALEQISDAAPSHRRTDPGYTPRDWDAQDSVPAPPHEDQWDTAGASAPPAPVLADGDYREQPWDYVWDDRPGQPADSSTPATASFIDSADAGVQQALSAGHDEADDPSGWPASRSGADQLPPLDGRPSTWPCQGRMRVCTSPLIMGRCPVKYRAFIDSVSGLALTRHGRLRREHTGIAGRASSAIPVCAE